MEMFKISRVTWTSNSV